MAMPMSVLTTLFVQEWTLCPVSSGNGYTTVSSTAYPLRMTITLSIPPTSTMRSTKSASLPESMPCSSGVDRPHPSLGQLAGALAVVVMVVGADIVVVVVAAAVGGGAGSEPASPQAPISSARQAAPATVLIGVSPRGAAGAPCRLVDRAPP